MKKIQLVLFVCMFFALFSACSEEEKIEKPIIEIKSPAENDTFFYGNKIKVKLSFKDTDGILAYSYTLIPQNLTGVNFNFEKKMFVYGFMDYLEIEHAIEVSEEHSPNVKFDDGAYILRIYCEDHKGTLSTKDLKINIKNKI